MSSIFSSKKMFVKSAFFGYTNSHLKTWDFVGVQLRKVWTNLNSILRLRKRSDSREKYIFGNTRRKSLRQSRWLCFLARGIRSMAARRPFPPYPRVQLAASRAHPDIISFLLYRYLVARARRYIRQQLLPSFASRRMGDARGKRGERASEREREREREYEGEG